MLLFHGGHCSKSGRRKPITVNTIGGCRVPSGQGSAAPARSAGRDASTSAAPSAPARGSRWCASSSSVRGCTARAPHRTGSRNDRRGRTSGRPCPGWPAPGHLVPHVPWKACDSIPLPAFERPDRKFRPGHGRASVCHLRPWTRKGGSSQTPSSRDMTRARCDHEAVTARWRRRCGEGGCFVPPCLP
jgi:hypothetical protein